MSSRKISIEPEQKEIGWQEGETLAQSIQREGIELNTLCGGRGRCGKCKVRLLEGELSEVTPAEEEKISSRALEKGYRLACQAEPLSDISLSIPVESLPTAYKLQTEGLVTRVEPKPRVKKFPIQVEKPDIDNVLSDEDRLLSALKEQQGVEASMSYHSLLGLPDTIREEGGRVTAVVHNSSVITVEAGDSSEENYGIALDLGTSKIAGFLMNLNTGEVLQVSSHFNPQKRYGGDIISRITYASEGQEELESIQSRAIRGINTLVNRIIEKCCIGAGVERDSIYEMSVVGNTAMVHLLLGFDPTYIGRSPFPPVRKRSIEVSADTLGINIHPLGVVYVLPIIGGFVGADAVGVCMSTGILKAQKPVMVLDIGTNNEIMLGDQNGVVATSSPSGPAFEGAHITHGMRASEGAIESVFIDPDTGELRYKTIGGASPQGICGSGMIDLVAELLKAGMVSRRGRLREGSSERIVKGEKGLEFVLAFEEESGTGKRLVFTQHDMGEFLKAKAAVHTGARIIMERKGIEVKDIRRLLLAGAFGSYINPESARTVGMIPEVPVEKIKSIGNAAGTGSRMALISMDMREEAEKISREVEHFHLERAPHFTEEFMASLRLPHRNRTRYPGVEEELRQLMNKRKVASSSQA